MSKLTDHVVLVYDIEKVRAEHPNMSPLARHGCCFCTRCEEHFNIEYPIDLDMVDAVSKGFLKRHRECQSK